MWVALAVCAFVFWGAIYFTFFQANGMSVRAPNGGGRRVPPEPHDVWVTIATGEDGATEEQRFLLDEGRWRRQVRRRSAAGAVLEVLVDEKYRV